MPTEFDPEAFAKRLRHAMAESDKKLNDVKRETGLNHGAAWRAAHGQGMGVDTYLKLVEWIEKQETLKGDSP